MFDTEKFIMEVEKRPILWNNNEKTTVGDKDAKQRAWDEVGAEMYFKWNLFTPEMKTEKDERARSHDSLYEKNVLFCEAGLQLFACELIKRGQLNAINWTPATIGRLYNKLGRLLYKKWKNIRDYFLKELKAQRKRESGASTAKHKKYVHFDMLRFLIPVLETKKGEGYLDDFDNTVMDNPLPESAHEIEFVDLSNNRQDVAPNKNTSFQEKIPLVPDTQCNANREDIDTDKAFFISLLPLVKKLNDQQKLDLKLEILQAVKRIQNSNSPLANLPLYYQCPHCQLFTPTSPNSVTVSSKIAPISTNVADTSAT